MRKIGIFLSIFVGILGLACLGIFFSVLSKIMAGNDDGLIYLLGLFPLAYSCILLMRFIREKNFHETHRITIHLLLWPTLLSLAFALYMIFEAFRVGEGLGIWFAIVVFIIGLGVSTLLSFIGFIIESSINKKKAS